MDSLSGPPVGLSHLSKEQQDQVKEFLYKESAAFEHEDDAFLVCR